MDFASNVSGGTPPYTATWNFGDGSTNASISTSHAFAAPGDYNVSVLVGDGIGAIAVARTTVEGTRRGAEAEGPGFVCPRACR